MAMKRVWFILVLVVLVSAGGAQATDSSYEAEKAKAMKYPYANDLGATTIDVSAYPREMQDVYRDIFQIKCRRCHDASRALNAPFVEPSGPRARHAAMIARWKAENPKMFKDGRVWQIEGGSASGPGIWERCVKRMMQKPGCTLSSVEGKKVWQFLCYDSERRKTGAGAATWAEYRRKLLADFKAKYPDRYRDLYEVQ
jgi:hypothetical protein